MVVQRLSACAGMQGYLSYCTTRKGQASGRLGLMASVKNRVGLIVRVKRRVSLLWRVDNVQPPAGRKHLRMGLHSVRGCSILNNTFVVRSVSGLRRASSVVAYRAASPIKQIPPPQDSPTTLGTGLQ